MIYFTEEDKIAIYHRFALFEKKLRDKHMVIEAPPAGWGASTTVLIRTNLRESYNDALKSATREAKEAIEDLAEH